MKKFPSKLVLASLLSFLMLQIFVTQVGYAGSDFLSGLGFNPPDTSYGTAYRDKLDSLLTGLFSISPNVPGTPGDNAPVVESVAPNFSGLVTGGGPQNSGVEITSDGALVVRSDNAPLAFGVQSNNANGFGIISKSTAPSGIGLYSVGNQVGIYTRGNDVALQAEGTSNGISVKGDSEIGIKAESGSGIGSMFEGNIGLQAEGQEFGVLGIGKEAGVIGYFSDSDWGSLGYVSGGTMYGLYTDSLTKVRGKLDSFGTFDVADVTNVSGSIGVSKDASFSILQTNVWDNTVTDNPITWYADDVSVTRDLEGSANLSVNTSRGSGNDFVIKDGGLEIGGSTIDSGGRSFKVTSDLEVKNGDLFSDGKITAGSEIGSFYYRQSSEGSTVSASCDSNDWLVGCSGQVFSGDGYIENSTPSDRTCSVTTTNSSTKARAYAYCFDPTTVSNTSDGLSSLPDTDSGGGDGFPDFQDNCPDDANSDQRDSDRDGIGDVCEEASCVPSTEVCDGVDNDCDGQIDEGLFRDYYRDFDQDNYGNPDVSTSECSQPSGYVSNDDDCNDFDRDVHPGATEVCNEIDDDCDGRIDEGLSCDDDPPPVGRCNDFDGDGYDGGPSLECPTGTDCNDGAREINPGASEVCDGADNDCNGIRDDYWAEPC